MAGIFCLCLLYQPHLGADGHCVRITHFAKNIALSLDGINHHATRAGIGNFAAQFVHEDINDFWFWLINSAIKMVQECIFAHNGAFT